MRLPVYDEVYSSFQKVEVVMSPSEAHGLLCGMLVRDSSVGESTFCHAILGEFDANDVLAGETVTLLKELYAITSSQMQDPLLGLQLMLPDDDTLLEEKIRSAGGWARGFLIGWSKLQSIDLQTLSPDIKAFLVDCQSLATEEFDVGEEDNEADLIYEELIEYLRMGTLLVQEELQPIKEDIKIH